MTFPLSHAAQVNDAPVVRLGGVGVRFGTNQVLRDVSLDLFPGSITALLGTNGAGKSTLIGAISGANAGYTGDIAVAGTDVRLTSPARARRAGIETVHQRIADGIVPGLSVADNLALTDLATGGHRLVRRTEAERVARAALERLGLSWSDEVLRADAARLGTSDAQLLVLARALRSTPRLLILDEPTSALTAAEADRLFAVLRVLRDEGLSILFVSHRFGEIERLADRIVVLRDGGLELEALRPFDWQAALEAMLGVPTELQQHITDPLPAHAEVLTVDDAVLLPGAAPLALSVAAGQVTGILGLLGAGKTELAEIVAGVRPAGTARLRLDGAPYRPASPAAAKDAGVVLVPEDRQRQGIQPGWSIGRTVGLPVLRQISRWGVVSPARERAAADDVIDAYGVVAPSADTRVDDLSGGNQQKVVVGRWLRTGPRLAVLDEPFRGVDIGARRRIGDSARDRAAEGAAVLVLSSDVDEILDVADRIVVLVSGRIVLDTPAGVLDRARIVAALLDDPGHRKETA
ncbi:MAG: ABC transporter [Microbacterium sp. 71-36]|uniref:sugar ABC transporter ATP-binding protein n=1 Tax=unclassified Microbacterium TaxID=2609290 RepID=UPI0008697DD6|nr:MULTISPECIES: sugar ABC transporter ATP-binding protein [unclassified Microbacterium]MBN9211819.1 sugar ABC transporter ATP-binding protein [Microbacterium sp.]ODT36687.1 MAG: ABC transporter [Microbacterium sp. SCN 71-17]ODU52327.1 MAG: ABC transporter [Microbacterium sp. SCN 70-10]OJV78185.1 MAG: ABC transporter [Microbacterium sp. 71-36]